MLQEIDQAGTKTIARTASVMDALFRPMLIAIDVASDAKAPPPDNLMALVDFTAGGLPVVSAGKHAEPIVLYQPPMVLTGILVGDPASLNAKKFIDWLKAYAPANPPPVVEWRRGTEAEALRRVTAELSRQVLAGLARQGQSAQEVVRMRAINAELQYRFAVSEDVLHRRGQEPFELAFTNDPVVNPPQYVVLAETPTGISQVLPTGSAGVMAVGIHFGAAGDLGGTQLHARLKSLEDGRTIAQWLIPAGDIVAGWNLLGLPRALAGQSRTLELVLTQQNADEKLPALSLGSGQPIPSFQVKDGATGRPALTNSLALQVWRSLPGIALPFWLDAHKATRSKASRSGFTEQPLAPGRIAQAQHANPEAVSFDFSAVVAPPGEGAIVCHPPSHGFTLAILANAARGGAVRISAMACINNAQSRDVDFALIVADDAARASEICEGRVALTRHEAFSGWCTVSHQEAQRISAFRDSSDAPSHIFIATRMSEPGDNSFAWARFENFTLMLQA